MQNIDKKINYILIKNFKVVNYINLKKSVLDANLKNFFNIYTINILQRLKEKSFIYKNNVFSYIYNYFFFLKYFLVLQKSVKRQKFKDREIFDLFSKNKKIFLLKFLNRYMLKGNFIQIFRYFQLIITVIKKNFKVNFSFFVYILLHLSKISFMVKKRKKSNKTFFILKKLLPHQYNLFFFFFLRKIREKKKNFISLFIANFEYIFFLMNKSIFYKQLLLLLDLANESKTNITNIKPPRLAVLEKKKF